MAEKFLEFRVANGRITSFHDQGGVGTNFPPYEFIGEKLTEILSDDIGTISDKVRDDGKPRDCLYELKGKKFCVHLTRGNRDLWVMALITEC